MSFWSRVAFWRKKGTPDDWFREFGTYGRSATGISVNQMTAMQASAVMACVSILSEDVAKLPLHIYRRTKGGGKEIAEKHPLERVLQRPNGWQNRFEFVEMLQSGLLLRGNAFAAILRDGRGNPTSLVPLNPDRVTLYEAPTGELFYMVARQGLHLAAVLEKMPVMIPAEDVFHVRWLSGNSLVGLSRIGLAREAIALSLSQQNQAAHFAGNGATPGGILQTDKKLSDDVIKRLKVEWSQRHEGQENAGKTAVLEEGLKWQQLGMTSADAQFLESRKFQVEEIARLFRMPLHKIGVSERMAGTQAIQADQDYMNNTISSYVERWEAKIDEAFDLAEQGLFSQFDVSRFLRADIQTRFTAYRTGISGIFLTPNEVRAAEGLPEVKGGDTLMQPANFAPFPFIPAPAIGTEELPGPGSDLTGAPADGGAGDGSAVPDAGDSSSPTG